MLSLSMRLLVQSMFFIRILIIDSPKHLAFVACTRGVGKASKKFKPFGAFLPLTVGQIQHNTGLRDSH